MAIKYIPEPFRIKSVEPLCMLTREERESRLIEAKYNLFGLKGEDCAIDLLTDSGTGAMSTGQWAGIMRGDEAYAGAASYEKLIDTARDLFGYDYIQPVHQGRAAEKVLFPLLLSAGKLALSNMFFDTTRAHVELAGARCIDCVVEAARHPAERARFKGNMDVPRLEQLLREHGGRVGLIVMTITNNSAGGQPVSMQNLREVAALARQYGIPVCIDAARYAENAYFIQRDEAEYKDVPIPRIVREMFSHADLFTMSAKKDAIVNMGGLLGVRDGASDLIQGIRTACISYEGFYTYGGLSGRDMEALAVGLREGIDESYLRYRIGQMEYLGGLLDDAGIAYQSPVGGHGIFVDAAALLPHIPYTEYPGQVLAIELYREAGIRSCDIGSYMLGNDPDTGKQLQASFEFTRLAIPRRVYTQAHLDVVAEALSEIKQRAHRITRGYRITWEPPILRHFQSSLEPIAA
ncbi:Tryptophanase [Castellaniella defragrans 65Phen]|jgi:tryptophanase|uniref:Tryptophanase n=1 Tax=Castellaniella defragrans (strain DSM 12143 / CCUG 39792 / 65Phen) TaxID=1437824 RepID=W8WX32_CASD6|nr:tryptophanase [Castellaniella defragrans]CDM24298.1 Tryptophanase [Castellaniella defragrans 65Phen]